jgi:hypothetical protein
MTFFSSIPQELFNLQHRSTISLFGCFFEDLSRV